LTPGIFSKLDGYFHFSYVRALELFIDH